MTKPPSAHVDIVWFKRDLRVEDHQPLVRAAEGGRVLPVYIYEPDLYRGEDFDAGHLDFINQCLKDLRSSLRALGTDLYLVKGEATEVLERLHQTHGIRAIHSHLETGGGLSFKRDLRVKAWAQNHRIAWHEYRQHGVTRALVDRDGWAGRWNDLMKRTPFAAPTKLAPLSPRPTGAILSAADLDLSPRTRKIRQDGGEAVAKDLLESFLAERGERYQKEMSSPNTNPTACSRLSPHLAYGSISMRTVFQATEDRRLELKARRAEKIPIGADWLRSMSSFSKRLRWHCHFIQKLESQPSIEFQNIARAYDGMREADFNEAHFQAWCAGRTGYPMVDACMRSLVATGWLGFRMRAMLMSFASYHLWLHWRPTAIFLAKQFVDFEPGIHYSQSQMQSGTTGINTVRIYSPTKQVHDHDPSGSFIRRWVPELAGVPDDHIAEPHLMEGLTQRQAGCVIGKDYPAPIVEHREAVRLARSRIYKVRSTAEARAEAQEVYQRHGSRRRPTKRSSKRSQRTA